MFVAERYSNVCTSNHCTNNRSNNNSDHCTSLGHVSGNHLGTTVIGTRYYWRNGFYVLDPVALDKGLAMQRGAHFRAQFPGGTISSHYKLGS